MTSNERSFLFASIWVALVFLGLNYLAEVPVYVIAAGIVLAVVGISAFRYAQWWWSMRYVRRTMRLGGWHGMDR